MRSHQIHSRTSQCTVISTHNHNFQPTTKLSPTNNNLLQTFRATSGDKSNLLFLGNFCGHFPTITIIYFRTTLEETSNPLAIFPGHFNLRSKPTSNLRFNYQPHIHFWPGTTSDQLQMSLSATALTSDSFTGNFQSSNFRGHVHRVIATLPITPGQFRLVPLEKLSANFLCHFPA